MCALVNLFLLLFQHIVIKLRLGKGAYVEGVKYLDEPEAELVRKDMRTRSVKSIKSMIDSFEKGGLKTCVDIAREELRLRQEDFMELLKDNLEVDLDMRGARLEATIYYWNDGIRNPISSSSINLPLD